MAEGDLGVQFCSSSAHRTAGSGAFLPICNRESRATSIRKYKEMLSPLGHLKQVVLSNALRPSGMSVG